MVWSHLHREKLKVTSECVYTHTEAWEMVQEGHTYQTVLYIQSAQPVRQREMDKEGLGTFLFSLFTLQIFLYCFFFSFFALGTSKYYTRFSISENYMHNLKKYQKLRTQALAKPPWTSQRAMVKESSQTHLASLLHSSHSHSLLGVRGFRGKKFSGWYIAPSGGTIYE